MARLATLLLETFAGSARILMSPLVFTPGTRLGVYEVAAQIGEGPPRAENG